MVEDVEIKTYSVIYNAIEDVEAAMKGLLDPVYKEVVIGNAEVRQTYKVSNVGIIVQLYQVSTGEMVFADVTVNQSNYNVTITINDTTSAGTLASGTYRVVIFG